MAILKVVIGLLLVVAVLSGSWWVYENFKTEIGDLGRTSYSPDLKDVEVGEVSSDVKQFYKNMRFNHNEISYFINQECGSEKENKMIQIGRSGKKVFYIPKM